MVECICGVYFCGHCQRNLTIGDFGHFCFLHESSNVRCEKCEKCNLYNPLNPNEKIIPAGVELRRTYSGKPYYLDHRDKTTSWNLTSE